MAFNAIFLYNNLLLWYTHSNERGKENEYNKTCEFKKYM